MSGTGVDYFALLKVPAACEVDTALLEKHYRELQNQWHPDRFAGAPQAEKMAAVQQTSLLNDAYTTLKSPLSRAAHLLALQGVDVASHQQAQLEQAFLLQQMELGDELETAIDSGSIDALDTLRGSVEQERQALWQAFQDTAEAEDWEQARREYYKLQFMHRLLSRIREAEDRLLEY